VENKTLELVINLIVSLGGIPWVTNLVKKYLPKLKRFAPIVVVILAGIYVIIGNIVGLNPDFSTTIEKLFLVLGLSGGSVLAYDTVKTTLKNE